MPALDESDNTPAGFPVPDPIKSFWLTAEDDFATHRTTDHLPEVADVVVIGSGFSGAVVAYELMKSQNEQPLSVVILEARNVCSGATGRNGGHCKPDTYVSWPMMSQLLGPHEAAEIVKFEMQGLMDVKRLVEDEAIDCDFHLTRAYDVFMQADRMAMIGSAFAAMRAQGINDSADIQFVDDARAAERISGVKGALGCFSLTCASLWPYKLITHLLKRAVASGANLQCNTAATALSDEPDAAGLWTVDTPRGAIKVRHVVVATNAYTPALLPEFRGKITPVRGVAAHIAVPESAPNRAPHLNNSYCIRFGPGEYDYLVARPDGSIVVGGAKQVLLKDSASWENNIDDASVMPGAEEYFQGYMQRTFHGWEGSGAVTTGVWTGVMGYSADMVPFVGGMEGCGRKGVWVSVGHMGHGMPRILQCSRALARLVKGEVGGLAETGVPGAFWMRGERLRGEGSAVGGYMMGKRGL